MLSQAAAQPPPAGGGAPPPQQGLAAHMGDAFPRSGSSSGLAQPPPTALQLQQELLGGPLSRGPSPATSLTNTPRTLSSGLGVPQPGGPPPADLGAAGGKGWSSLDGIARPNWQQLAGAPSDGILSAGGGQQAALGAGLHRPPSTGPNSLSSSYGAGGSNLLRGSSGPSPPASLGLSGQLQQLAAQQQRGGIPSGLPPGPSAAQQQLLQQQLLQQQQQQQQQRGAGLPPGATGGYGQPGPQQQQAQSLANLQAAAQAAQAAQAAAMRQQMLRNALQPQTPAPTQPNLGNLLQHALLQQQQQQQQAAGNLLHQQNATALLQQQQNLLNQASALQRAAQQAQQDQLLQGQLNNLALQQQLNINQAAAGMRPGGLAGLNPALAAALLGSGATAQQLQAVQQLQGQQQLAAQQAQQQLLLSQALRANGLQAGLGQRPAAQLQSEALIAMQRQQALQAQGVRVPQGGGGVGGTGFTAEQLLQLQQLGLLNKPAPPPSPAGGGSMTAQQQAALLSALQAGSQQQKVAAQLALQQQSRPAGPPGLANGAAFLGGQPQAQVRPPSQQLQQANLLAALGGQRPPLPPQAGAARPPSGPGAALAGLGGQAAGQQNDPIQTLQDIGKTLAQLNITVEAAVNAGLLGGLSASDVKIVAEAHRAEMEVARSGTPNPQQAGGATPPIPIAPGGGPLSAPGSLGAPTPPAPASPAHSHASAAAAVLGASGPGRSISGAPAASEASGGGASDDDFPLDAEEPVHAKAPIDEAALKAKVEQMAAQFDASQYGFFGGAPVAEEGGLLLGELEGSGGSGALEGSNDAVEQPARPSSDPGAGAGEGTGDRYQLWGGALLPDELDSKLNLGPAEAGRGSAPPSAPPSVAAGSPPAGTAGAAGVQPTADIASLWGNAQGDRNDPFGSYLAGLRLGTGF